MLHSSQLLGLDELRNLLQVGHFMLLPHRQEVPANAGILWFNHCFCTTYILTSCCCQQAMRLNESSKSSVCSAAQVADAVTAMLLGPDICTSGHAAMKRHLKGQAGSCTHQSTASSTK
jgi:hypothetical protein